MTWPSWSLYAKLSLLDRDIGPDIFDESKPHECPYRLNPKTCTCSSCTQTKKVAYSKQLLAEEEAVNFGFSKNIQRDGATFGSMRAPEPQPAPRETTKEKYERQRKERYDQLEKTTAYLKAEYSTPKATKKTISVTSPSIEEMLDNPELDGISSVNIDPVSMAVETVVDLVDGAKEFIANPSLGSAAMVAVAAIPGKMADKVVDKLPIDKWSRSPKSIQDKMTLESAMEGNGITIIKNLGNPEFKGMDKMELKVKSANGRDSVVHYVKNPKTGELMDFKFKKHSTDGLSAVERIPDVRKGTY